MTAWRVIELAKKPAGYADHKPPYDFKHGWVPVSGAAQSAVTKERELPPLLKQKPAWQSQEAYDAQVANYFDKFPEGWKPDPASDPEPPVPKPKAKKPAARRTPKRKGPVDAKESAMQLRARTGSTSAQRKDASLELVPEWESATVEKDLSPDEAWAKEEWFGGEDDYGNETYVALNDYKRNGINGQFAQGWDQDHLDEIDQHLTSALPKSKTTRDMVLYRGLRDGRPPLSVGDTIQDPGWQSLTYSYDVSRGFARLDGNASKAKILIISVPKGSNLLNIKDPIELELLAGPNTPMKVTKIDGEHVYVEMS
jgi:hypothetical protein